MRCGKKIELLKDHADAASCSIEVDIRMSDFNAVNKHSPEVGASSRLIHRNNVDLPEPDGPITQTSSLGLTAKSMPFNTSSEPYDLNSFLHVDGEHPSGFRCHFPRA
jgi:hypothetical protein